MNTNFITANIIHFTFKGKYPIPQILICFSGNLYKSHWHSITCLCGVYVHSHWHSVTCLCGVYVGWNRSNRRNRLVDLMTTLLSQIPMLGMELGHSSEKRMCTTVQLCQLCCVIQLTTSQRHVQVQQCISSKCVFFIFTVHGSCYVDRWRLFTDLSFHLYRLDAQWWILYSMCPTYFLGNHCHRCLSFRFYWTVDEKSVYHVNCKLQLL